MGISFITEEIWRGGGLFAGRLSPRSGSVPEPMPGP